MTLAVRPDLATRSYQLAAYTTVSGDTSTRVAPWASDANGPRSPVGGIILQLPAGDVVSANTGGWIEVGGPDLTAGNGLVLKAGESEAVSAPNAASIRIIASKAGLVIRAQVQ